MKYCPNDECDYFLNIGIRGEYRDEFERCSDCGAGLVSELPPARKPAVVTVPEVATGVDFAVVSEFENPLEAHLARGRLEHEGIAVQTQVPDRTGLDQRRGASLVRLLVPRTELAHAKSILETPIHDGVEVSLEGVPATDHDDEDHRMADRLADRDGVDPRNSGLALLAGFFLLVALIAASSC